MARGGKLDTVDAVLSCVGREWRKKAAVGRKGEWELVGGSSGYVNLAREVPTVGE